MPLPSMAEEFPTRAFRLAPIIVDSTDSTPPTDCTINENLHDIDTSKQGMDCPTASAYEVPAVKTLRRKKDMELSVKRYSAPPASPLLDMKFDDYIPSTPPLTTDSGSSGFASSEAPSTDLGPYPAHHYRTQSQPTPPVRVGHPMRPYYSIIRPRPTSLISLSPSMPSVIIPMGSSSRPSLDTKYAESSRFQRNSTFLDVQIQANGDVVLPTPSALSPPVSLAAGTSHLPFAALGSLVTPSERRDPMETEALNLESKSEKLILRRVRKGLKRMFSFSRHRS